jgi:tetratricopeptide (TPR) repeat protein
LLVSYALLGDVALGKQEVEKSADYYRQYHELAQKLAASDPDNIQLQRDLATSYDRQGYVMSQSGKREEAREFYRKNYELVKKLSVADPSNQPIRQDLAAACATLGDLNLQLNDVGAARTYLAEFLDVTRLRMKEHAEDRAARRDLIDALLRNGDLHLRLRELPIAATELAEAHEAALRAVTADPGDVGTRMYLANTLSLLGQYEVQNRDADAAAKHLKSGIAEMRRAVEKADAPLQSQVAAWIKEQEAAAARCATAIAVTADPSLAGKQDADVAAEMLDYAAATQLRNGKIDETRSLLEKLAKLEPADGEKRFLAARRYAAAAGAKPASSQQKQFAEQAMALLHEAQKLKVFDDVVAAAQLEFAVDFAGVRERDDFKKLLAEVRGGK